MFVLCAAKDSVRPVHWIRIDEYILVRNLINAKFVENASLPAQICIIIEWHTSRYVQFMIFVNL